MKIFNPFKGQLDLKRVFRNGYFTKFETYLLEITSFEFAWHGEDFFNNL